MARNNVIMIGYMGAGKTSVGKRLARELKLGFLDMDEEIVKKEGMSIADIFRMYGEEAFRQMETRLLETLIESEECCVISTGGGLPLRLENRCLLKELGTVVYLEVSKDTVVERLSRDTTRPLLAGDNMEDRVSAMLLERGPSYREAADLAVDVNGKTVGQITEEIRRQL